MLLLFNSYTIVYHFEFKYYIYAYMLLDIIGQGITGHDVNPQCVEIKLKIMGHGMIVWKIENLEFTNKKSFII